MFLSCFCAVLLDEDTELTYLLMAFLVLTVYGFVVVCWGFIVVVGW